MRFLGLENINLQLFKMPAAEIYVLLIMDCLLLLHSFAVNNISSLVLA